MSKQAFPFPSLSSFLLLIALLGRGFAINFVALVRLLLSPEKDIAFARAIAFAGDRHGHPTERVL